MGCSRTPARAHGCPDFNDPQWLLQNIGARVNHLHPGPQWPAVARSGPQWPAVARSGPAVACSGLQWSSYATATNYTL